MSRSLTAGGSEGSLVDMGVDGDLNPFGPQRYTIAYATTYSSFDGDSNGAEEEEGAPMLSAMMRKQMMYDQRRRSADATNCLNQRSSKLWLALCVLIVAMSLTIFVVERRVHGSVAVLNDDRGVDDYVGAYKDDDDDNTVRGGDDASGDDQRDDSGDDDGGDDDNDVDVDVDNDGDDGNVDNDGNDDDDDDYSSDGSLVLSVTNCYGKTKSSTSLKYPFLDGNNQLFEPYKEHTVRVHNIDSSYSYSYSLLNSDGDEAASGTMDIATYSGKSIAYFTSALEEVGQYDLTVTEYSVVSTEKTVQQEITAAVHCKYIRREITSLNEDDREEFLDALYSLWSTNTVDGQELYGDRYKSLYYLATVHMDAGANPVCDEFHSQSGGFLNNHVMLNQFLEQSLQLVNPRVALHYLEYPKYFTEDYDDSFWSQHMANTLDGGSWCALLSDTYFGTNDPYTGEIVDSRWAAAEIPFMNDQFFIDHGITTDETFFPEEEEGILAAGAPYHLTSPLGLLRSPWNFNPSRKITRFNNVNQVSGENVDLGVYNFYEGVDCEDWSNFAELVKDHDLMDFMAYMEDDAHGKIHFTFGGSGGDSVVAIDAKLRDDFGFDDDDLIVTAQYTQTLVKLRYAHYNWEFSEQNYKQMVFSCNSTTRECELNPWFLDGEDEDRIDFFFIDIFYNTVKDDTPQYDVVLKALSLDGYDEKLELATLLVSRFQYDGDMAGASAAVDPLFWIVHASMEKLYQKMREQDFFSSTEYYRVDDHSCSGHNADGKKYWLTGYYMLNESIDASEVTNAEWVDYLNPMSDLYADNFKFVYDTFDYAAWCPSLAEVIGGDL